MLRLVVSGMVAGVAGGIVFSTLLTVMMVTGRGAAMVTLMQLLAGALGSGRLLAGWIAVLGAGAALGGVFASLVGRRHMQKAGTVAGAALFLGLGLWFAEGLVGIPLLFGLPPVVGLADPLVWPMVPAMLVSNLLFTSVLAAVFLGLRPRTARARGVEARDLRRAA